MILRIGLITVLLGMYVPVVTAAVEVTASVDRTTVPLDSRLIFSVVVEGAQGASAPALPPMDGLQVVRGPSTSTHIQMVNGMTSMRTVFEYVLKPVKVGSVTIPAVGVRYRDVVYDTQPITVKILEAGAAPPPGGGGQVHATGRQGGRSGGRKMFVELAVDKDEVFIHEQVVLLLRFYYSDVRVVGHPSYEDIPTPGFIQKALGAEASRNYTRVIDGRLYNVSELSAALFPFKSGRLRVGPVRLKGAMLGETQRRQRPFGRMFDFDDFFDDSFFGQFEAEPFDLLSNEVEVNVKPLPSEGAPEGEVSVGRYKLRVDAKPREVNVGDPVTLTMKVSGEGDFESVSPPELSSTEGFKTYEVTSNTASKSVRGMIRGEKTFEQAIVPLNENIKAVPRIVFHYFDPEKGRYETVTQGPITLKVLPPKDGGEARIVALPEGVAKKGVKLLERNVVFIKTSPGSLGKAGERTYRPFLLWVLTVVPLMVVAGAFWHNRHRVRLRSDVGYARARGASRMTKERLRGAEAALRRNDVEAFYADLVKAVNGYIADKINIPAGGLTAELVAEQLENRSVGKKLMGRLSDFYEKCDLARFSSSTVERRDMEEAYDEATAILENLKKAGL
jgi:hypothetical protein